MPVTLASAVSWVLLAVGGAMFVGTGAALVTYRRTGRLPSDPGERPAPGVIRAAVVKCVLGLVAGVAGAIGLSVYGTAI